MLRTFGLFLIAAASVAVVGAHQLAAHAINRTRRAPLLLLGSDSYGRDVFSRLLFGGRVSLGLAVIAALCALLLGASVGGLAGYTRGTDDDVLKREYAIVLVL